MNYTHAVKALCSTLLFSSFTLYCFAAEKEMSRAPQRGATYYRAAQQYNGLIPLQIAVLQGDLLLVKKLFSAGADRNSKVQHDINWPGICPTEIVKNASLLHLAVQNGHLAVAQFLLQEGADKKALNKNFSTPLHTAVFNGHLGVTQFLVQEGSEIEAKNISEWTPLHIAVAKGHLSIAAYLLKQGACREAQNNNGRTPIIIATYNGNLDAVNLLLESEAKRGKTNHQLEVQDTNGLAPLQIATLKGNLPLVKVLLSAGADRNSKVQHDIKGPDLCATEIVKNASLLHLAAQNGHLAVAQFLVQEGADKKALNKNLSTPLHTAVFNGHLEVTQFLVQEGAEIEAKNIVEWTPLHVAVAKGHLSIAEYLVARGAHKEAKKNNGLTPLHIATCNDEFDIVRMLLRNGACIHAEGKDGFTPIYYTIQKVLDSNGKERTLFDYFLKAGADVSFKSGKKKLLYELLLMRKRDCEGFLLEDPVLDMIKKLLDEGVAITYEDRDLARLRKDAPALAAIETELRRRRNEPHPAERAEAMTSMIRDTCDLDERGLAQFVQLSAQSSRDTRLLKDAKKE